ncbi:hypothetical protein ANN_22880 [Periplaneta americana]|uniref:Uncharacterized protein n=1 Tax=Periplaneta americana TaxID=6978 RepID=A0ABQ8SJJ4_PERAM|nr:hypothetical protein ANN_22880 [Periplaneta americana]
MNLRFLKSQFEKICIPTFRMERSLYVDVSSMFSLPTFDFVKAKINGVEESLNIGLKVFEFLARQLFMTLSIKSRRTGSFLNKKHVQQRRVLTEEKLDEVGTRLEQSPRKSLRHLAQEVNISKTSAFMATKLLELKPYRVTVVRALQPQDPDAMKGFLTSLLVYLVARSTTADPQCDVGKQIVNGVDNRIINGGWYLKYGRPKSFSQEGGGCWLYDYVLSPDGTAQLTAFPTLTKDDQAFSLVATVQIVGKRNLNVTFSSAPLMWIGYREYPPSEASLEASKAALKKAGLKLEDFDENCE